MGWGRNLLGLGFVEVGMVGVRTGWGWVGVGISRGRGGLVCEWVGVGIGRSRVGMG